MITLEEFIEKYGSTKVTFSSYWKYSFTFFGTTEEGYTIEVSYGGCADDIYRFDVTAGREYLVSDGWSSISMKDQSGKELFNHIDE